MPTVRRPMRIPWTIETDTVIVERTRTLCQAMSMKETTYMMSGMVTANIPMLTVRRPMCIPWKIERRTFGSTFIV